MANDFAEESRKRLAELSGEEFIRIMEESGFEVSPGNGEIDFEAETTALTFIDDYIERYAGEAQIGEKIDPYEAIEHLKVIREEVRKIAE